MEIAYENDFFTISLNAKNINGVYSKWRDASLQIAYNKIHSTWLWYRLRCNKDIPHLIENKLILKMLERKLARKSS
ncbi:MAG: hypothetical protein ACFFCW_28355 [Candidatus Hodarchaeota archaeon]